MPFSDTARNTAADAIGAAAVRASLHTADPGDTGTNEIAGGTPAYSRQTITWDPATTGITDLAGNAVFNIPAGTTITHVGLWTAGGTWLGGEATTPLTFTTQGKLSLDTATTLDVS